MGGAPANFIYFVHVLGEKGILATRVGADGEGEELQGAFSRKGADTAYIQSDTDHPTGWVDIELNEWGAPSYVIHENVAWDFITPDQNLIQCAEYADAVYFGTLCQRSKVSRVTIRRCAEAVSKKALCVCDLNLRQDYWDEDSIEWSFQTADVVKLNDEEIRTVGSQLSISGDEQSLGSTLVDMFSLRVLALTRGSEGSILFTPDGLYEHPGYPVDIRDTVGAGDAFGAVLTVGLLRDMDIDDINDQANRIASFVCSQDGAVPDVPEELRVL